MDTLMMESWLSNGILVPHVNLLCILSVKCSWVFLLPKKQKTNQLLHFCQQDTLWWGNLVSVHSQNKVPRMAFLTVIRKYCRTTYKMLLENLETLALNATSKKCDPRLLYKRNWSWVSNDWHWDQLHNFDRYWSSLIGIWQWSRESCISLNFLYM